ncbi:MAG: hypothetical protein KatS3mg082_1398 [Nitrospiraceae bacterium]|nr:MAG: hypothetical protein KatS3mg082_1398 [Nitrospiraceae bacterium]
MADLLAWRILLGQCLNPQVDTTIPWTPLFPCGQCLACRAYNALGPKLIDEIYEALRGAYDRRRAPRRRKHAKAVT